MILADLTLKLVLTLALAQGAALPADPRLDPVRPRLEQLVDRTAASGLPAELVVSKVREGLAKGVSPDRIEAAVARLFDNLQAARTFAAERRSGPAPAPELVRALADARMAGIDLASADAVVRGGKAAPETARAVEVLTDLSLRGYPADRAAVLVKDLFARDAAALGKLPATLDLLRREQALSHAETVDALARGMRGGGSLEQASTRASAEERRKAPGGAARRGGEGAPGRKEGFIPPGQLKKQMPPKGPPAEPPGRGRGPR